MYVNRFSGIAATRPDARGVLTSRWGTSTRTPRGARGRKKSPNQRKVPRFRTGRLAFNSQDASLLPTPRMEIKIYAIGGFHS